MALLKNLVESIEKEKRGPYGGIVKKRLMEFENMMKKSSEEVFKELCFCILTANFNAERSILIQETLGHALLTLPKRKLAERLKALGHRHPNTRAAYIVEARKFKYSLKKILKSFRDEALAREWLARNIKGFGFKEASHFLRNVGFKNVAIIDFHIIDLLARYGLIEKQKSLSAKKYLEIERLLESIAKKTGVTLAELDLYLWCMETGKVLK